MSSILFGFFLCVWSVVVVMVVLALDRVFGIIICIYMCIMVLRGGEICIVIKKQSMYAWNMGWESNQKHRLGVTVIQKVFYLYIHILYLLLFFMCDSYHSIVAFGFAVGWLLWRPDIAGGSNIITDSSLFWVSLSLLLPQLLCMLLSQSLYAAGSAVTAHSFWESVGKFVSQSTHCAGSAAVAHSAPSSFSLL